MKINTLELNYEDSANYSTTSYFVNINNKD